MTNKTESRGLAAAYAQMTAAMMAIVIHPDYDPTVVGPRLVEYAKRMGEDPIFKTLSALTVRPESKRNVNQEVEDILRGAWPLGFDSKAAPEGTEATEGGNGEDIYANANTGTNRDPHSVAYTCEYPYGEEGKEFAELLASIEKNEGRPLISEEKLRALRAFNKAVHEGEPQSVTFGGTDGYLIVGTRMVGGLDTLLAGLDRALR